MRVCDCYDFFSAVIPRWLLRKAAAVAAFHDRVE